MKRCSAAKLAFLLGILGGAAPARAGAACGGMIVDADAGVRARWPGLLQRVRRDLAAREDVDVCARVELRVRDGGIGIDVTLPDGRTASRVATRRDDVLLTLEGLLLVPEAATVDEVAATHRESEAPSASSAPSEALAQHLPVMVHARSADPREDDEPSVGARPSRLRVELSAIGGARLGDGTAGVSLGAVSFLDIGGWLIGFMGRGDSYQGFSGGEPLAAFELAMPLGKRFQLASVALDLVAGPAVAMAEFNVSDTVKAPVGAELPPPEPVRETQGGPVPRLIVGARVGFSPRSVFRTFVGVDGEIGPAPQASTTHAGALELPIWTIGLAFGGTVGTE